jgi:hypothetical protein
VTNGGLCTFTCVVTTLGHYYGMGVKDGIGPPTCIHSISDVLTIYYRNRHSGITLSN